VIRPLPVLTGPVISMVPSVGSSMRKVFCWMNPSMARWKPDSETKPVGLK
jgi:hypothetical protein